MTESHLMRLRRHVEARIALLVAMEPLDERATLTKFHRLNELQQLVEVLESHQALDAEDPHVPPRESRLRALRRFLQNRPLNGPSSPSGKP